MDTTKTDEIEKHKLTQHYDVLRELGDCYTSVGNYSQAHRCYEKAASLGPDEPGPYVGLGVAALQVGKLDDAEVAFRVACRLDTRCAKAYAGLAMVAQQRCDYPQSFDLYMKSLELDTNNITALLGLFQVSCEMGSFAKVIYYLQVYLDMHPGDMSVMFALSALYLKDGQTERARDMLLNLLALEPTNQDAVNLLEEAEHTLAGVGQA
ncbi:MAG: tetratricopeptide repeat protein [Phycisphaerales bacterium]